MAAWRKEEVDAARHRQDKREATGLGESCYSTLKRRTCEATPIGRFDDPTEPSTSTRRTET